MSHADEIRLRLDAMGHRIEHDRETLRNTTRDAQRLVLDALTEGISKRETARRLGITVATVERWLGEVSR